MIMPADRTEIPALPYQNRPMELITLQNFEERYKTLDHGTVLLYRVQCNISDLLTSTKIKEFEGATSANETEHALGSDF